MPIWGAPLLSAEERQALEHDYRYGTTRLVRQRSHIVLLSVQLETQAEIARVVGCSADTVQRTLKLHQKGGRSALRARVCLRPSRRRRTLQPQRICHWRSSSATKACSRTSTTRN